MYDFRVSLGSIVQNLGDRGLISELLWGTSELNKARLIDRAEKRAAESRDARTIKKQRKLAAQKALKKYARSTKSTLPQYKIGGGVPTGTYLDEEGSSDDEWDPNDEWDAL